VWTVAAVSLVLPWIGLLLCLLGGARVIKGLPFGWWLLLAGVAMLVIDIAIDFVWAHPSISKSDQPELNRRGAQCVGRVYLLEEPIAHGRGKIRVGDTLWPVEGPDTAAGLPVRVKEARDTVLTVERI
jgi:membrane protein implicated in regulation of membrane protease activity